MAPRSCPRNFDRKCKWCPIEDPFERVEECTYFRGQVASGVPWHWGDRRLYDEWDELRAKAIQLKTNKAD